MIGVNIVNYMRGDLTRNAVVAFRKHIKDDDVKLIVVDGTPGSDEVNSIKPLLDDYIVGGDYLSTNWNMATEALSDCNIIIYLNSDVVITGRDWYDNLINNISPNNVGITMCSDWQRDKQPPLKQAAVVGGYWFWAGAISKECLDTIGLWDERLRVGCTDWDIEMRAQAAGYKMVLVPNYDMYHIRNQSLNAANAFDHIIGVDEMAWASIQNEPQYKPAYYTGHDREVDYNHIFFKLQRGEHNQPRVHQRKKVMPLCRRTGE